MTFDPIIKIRCGYTVVGGSRLLTAFCLKPLLKGKASITGLYIEQRTKRKPEITLHIQF